MKAKSVKKSTSENAQIARQTNGLSLAGTEESESPWYRGCSMCGCPAVAKSERFGLMCFRHADAASANGFIVRWMSDDEKGKLYEFPMHSPVNCHNCDGLVYAVVRTCRRPECVACANERERTRWLNRSKKLLERANQSAVKSATLRPRAEWQPKCGGPQPIEFISQEHIAAESAEIKRQNLAGMLDMNMLSRSNNVTLTG